VVEATRRFRVSTEKHSRTLFWLTVILIVLTVIIGVLTALLAAHDMDWIPMKPAQRHDSHAESG
jgi:hypothetical protein